MTKSKDANKLKLLYIGKHKNKILTEFLSKKYNVTTCQYVLPNSIENKLGNLKFEYPLFQFDPHWEFALGNDFNIQTMQWDFGIDLNSPQITKAPLPINLKYYLAIILSSLGFKINFEMDSITLILKQDIPQHCKLSTRNSKIKEPIKTRTFLNEKDLLKFDLIIIENQILKTKIEKQLFDPHTTNLDGYFASMYYLYNVAPSTVSNLFEAGKKILIFMDDLEYIEQLDQDCFRRYHSYLKKIFHLEIVLLDNNINKLITKSKNAKTDNYFTNFPHFLNVVDKSHSIDGNIRNFDIEVNSSYIKNTIPLFKYFWNSLNIEKLIVSSLISYRNLSRYYNGNNVLLGNKGATGYCKLYSNQTTFDDVNIVYSYNPTIGILELNKSNKFSLIPHSLINEENIMNKKIGNIKFVNAIIKSLVDSEEFFRNSEFGLTPKIVLSINNGELMVNGIKIKLLRMEFCYYRFFLERALNRIPHLSLKNELRLNSEYKPNLDNIPEPIIKKILKYYEASFQEKMVFSRLSNKLDLGKTPNIKQTFIPHIHKINKKIMKILSSRVEERFLEKILIQCPDNSFFISIEPQFIEIIKN